MIYSSARQNLRYDLCDLQILSTCASMQYSSGLVYPNMNSPESVEGTCDQWNSDQTAWMCKLIWVAHVLLQVLSCAGSNDNTKQPKLSKIKHTNETGTNDRIKIICRGHTTSQSAFYVNLYRAVIGPSGQLTGRWRPDIDLRRMLAGLGNITKK